MLGDTKQIIDYGVCAILWLIWDEHRFGCVVTRNCEMHGWNVVVDLAQDLPQVYASSSSSEQPKASTSIARTKIGIDHTKNELENTMQAQKQFSSVLKTDLLNSLQSSTRVLCSQIISSYPSMKVNVNVDVDVWFFMGFEEETKTFSDNNIYWLSSGVCQITNDTRI